MEQEVKLPVDNFTEDNIQDNVEPSEPVVENSFEAEAPVVQEEVSENFEKEQTQEEPESEFKKDDEEEDQKVQDSQNSDDQEEDDKKKYSLLEQQYNELSTQYQQLKADYDTLVEFKNKVENEKKDALINEEFYMLSNEDKKEILDNKEKYSYDEIKAKLAVICFEKKVNFNLQTQEEIDSNKEQKIVTFSYSNDDSNLPDWVKAVKNNIDMENN